MKKMFFIVIALVAFSNVSMANTIDVEEIDLQKEEVVVTNCNVYASDAIKAETLQTGKPMTKSEFNKAYTEYYNFCVYSVSQNMTPLLPVVVQ